MRQNTQIRVQKGLNIGAHCLLPTVVSWISACVSSQIQAELVALSSPPSLGITHQAHDPQSGWTSPS